MKLNWTDLNFDVFLRRLDAPAMVSQPITVKDLRYGGEFIFAGSNLSPKIVKRNNLSISALLTPLLFGITDPVQISTGYNYALNSYFYGATWDGTNYYLRRFNAINSLSPYEDGYSVNIPAVDAVYGVALTDTKIVVALDYNDGTTIEKRLYYYNPDLSLDTYITNATPITGNIASDGEYIYWMDTANNLFRKYGATDYSLVQSLAWDTSVYPTPTDIMAYDKQAFYAFDNTNKKVVKFVVNTDNTISVVYSIDMKEDVKGILNYKSYIYYCYTSPNGLLATPLI